MPHFYAFNVLINAIFHHKVPAFLGELQSKRFTINNQVQLATNHGESTFQQVVSSSVRELTAECPSSINLQTFGKPMTVTACIKAMVVAILPMFTAQKASCYEHVRKIADRSPQASSLPFWPWIYTAAHSHST